MCVCKLTHTHIYICITVCVCVHVRIYMLCCCLILFSVALQGTARLWYGMSNCAMPLLCYVIFCFAMFGSAPQDQSGQHNADQCSAMVCCLFSALMCRVMLPCANVNAIAMLCLLDQVPMHACMHT